MNRKFTWTLHFGLVALVIAVLAACTETNTGPTQPRQFHFTAITGAQPGEVVTSNVVTITGTTLPLDAKITGADAVMLINGDPASASPKVKPGDKLSVRMTASATFGAQVKATVTVGTVKADFSVTTRASNTAPDAFEFEPFTGADPNEEVISNTVELAGFDGTLEASATGGILIVNGDDQTEAVEVAAGAMIAVRVTASADYEDAVTATVTVGTASADFVVTTKVQGQPTAFAFTPVTGAMPATAVTSSVVALEGFDGTLAASANGGTLIVNGVDQAGAANVVAGDTIAVRVNSSADYDTAVTATVTVGVTSADFVVTTRVEPVAPTVTSFTSSVANPDPGQLVTLSWAITGDYDTATLTGPGMTPQDVFGQTSQAVTVPGNAPTAEYTLEVTNTGLAASDDDSVSLSVPLWVCEVPSDVVTFEDPLLEAALRDLVTTFPTDPTLPITCALMQTLTSFDSNNYDGNEGHIQSLVGLQHAANLQSLVLQYNEVSDLRPIANLDLLTTINFDRNRVTDLSPISGLTSLVEAGFWDNGPVPGDDQDGIVDLSPLAGLVNLEVLYLSDNHISDLTPLTGLTNLRVLFAIGNNVSDLSPLAGLTSLRTLRVGFQQADGSITSIAPLANLTDLSWLELQFSRVTDLSLLGTLTHLHEVSLEGMALDNAQVAPLLGNLSFPDPTVATSDLGVGASPTATLNLASNCIDTLDPATSTLVAALQLRLVTVEGFTPAEQGLCLTGASLTSTRDARLQELRMSGGYR